MENTIQEIKDKLINQFEENEIKYGYAQSANYIDDDFDSVFQCMVIVIKELGIKLS